MANVVSPNAGTPLRSTPSNQTSLVADVGGSILGEYRRSKAEAAEQARLDKEDARAEREHQLDIKAYELQAENQKRLGRLTDAQAQEYLSRVEAAKRELQQKQVDEEAAVEIFNMVFNPQEGKEPLSRQQALQMGMMVSPGTSEILKKGFQVETDMLTDYADLRSTQLDNAKAMRDMTHTDTMNELEITEKQGLIVKQDIDNDILSMQAASDGMELQQNANLAKARREGLVKFETGDFDYDEFRNFMMERQFANGKPEDVDSIVSMDLLLLPKALADSKVIQSVQEDLAAKTHPSERALAFAGILRSALNGGKDGKDMLVAMKRGMDMTNTIIGQATLWYDDVVRGKLSSPPGDNDKYAAFRAWANENLAIGGFAKGIADLDTRIAVMESRIKSAQQSGSRASTGWTQVEVEQITNRKGEVTSTIKKTTSRYPGGEPPPEEEDDRADLNAYR